jgi:hypothetical protein
VKKTTTLTVLTAVVAGAIGLFAWSLEDDRTLGRGSTRGTADSLAADFLDAACAMPPRWIKYIQRGWSPGRARAQDIILVPQPYNYFGEELYTSHAGPYTYLQEVPLVFYGPGFVRALGSVDLGRETTLADIAATEASMLNLHLSGISGRPIKEILEEVATPPRLIVTISIDGGGMNVLRKWDSASPELKHLAANGASIEDAVVGSSPSITPPAHTTMSTGVFPQDHGVTGIRVRADDGSIVGGFAAKPNTVGAGIGDPTISLTRRTLADVWDLRTSNHAKVALLSSGNYALGFLGSGDSIRGGDRDIALLSTAEERWATNSVFFSLPSYVHELEDPAGELREVDRADGEIDGRWRGHDIPLEGSPALAPWTTRVAKAIVRQEGFGRDSITDLLYVHHKAPDIAGHLWNMIANEQKDVISSVDSAIGEFRRWLDRSIGAGSYVLVVTADHGQTPLGRGWGIDPGTMMEDIDRAFDQTDNGVGLVERSSTTSLFMNVEEMERNNVTPEEIASYLTDYTEEENALSKSELREANPNQRIFSAVFPGRKLERVRRCVQARVGM